MNIPLIHPEDTGTKQYFTINQHRLHLQTSIPNLHAKTDNLNKP